MPRIGNLLAGDRPMRKVNLPKATEGPAEGRWCRGRHPRLLRATPGSAVDGLFERNKNGGVGISTSKQTPCRRIRMSHHDAQARAVTDILVADDPRAADDLENPLGGGLDLAGTRDPLG